jgi:16S rRNA (guanine527-N7)-methyltransferase
MDFVSKSHHCQNKNRGCDFGRFGWFLLGALFLSHSSFKSKNGNGKYGPTVSAFQQIMPIGVTKLLKTGTQGRALLSAVADDDLEFSTTSMNFALSPTAEKAKHIVLENLGLSTKQYEQLAKLAVLVDDWNSSVNLISRKDCSPDVVFGRHILPSLAPLALLSSLEPGSGEIDAPLTLTAGKKVCDVGTGGGFPGLPLAIALPEIEFLLVDSVGKKIMVVQDMADKLGLTNVKTYHGRAESVSGKFAWVTGRSVSALPSFCFWIHHLLEKEDGRLVYLIGGELDEDILEEAIIDEEIEDLLDVPGVSDKRVLVFPKPSVDFLAEVSGEILKVPKRGMAGKGTSGGRPGGRTKGKSNAKPKNKTKAKGQWTKRDSTATKQRGYDNFKRFDSFENLS